MLKKIVIALTLPLLLFVVVAASLCRGALGSVPTAARRHSAVTTTPETGTLQKMIVENGSVTMDLDLNGLNGSDSLVARPAEFHFAVGANSFFPILVFNDLLRGLEPGSMTLIPVAGGVDPGITDAGYSYLPARLSASLRHLAVEKIPSNEQFDFGVRDSNTGFTFFNVEGGQFDYDANAQALSITNGRLLVSKEFANALGRPSDTGSIVGKISAGMAMQPIEVNELVNGKPQSTMLPAVGTVPGPDVIVGDLIGLEQSQTGSVGGRVGLALGTDACNKGVENVGWFQLPSNDHPFIPQNLYRLSGGVTNDDRFEQIGQSWGKHAFFAASSNDCGFGCNGVN